MNNTLLFEKSKRLLSWCFAFVFVLLSAKSFGQVAQFNFPATSSTVVSVKDPNVTVSNMTLSAGTIETKPELIFLMSLMLRKRAGGLLLLKQQPKVISLR